MTTLATHAQPGTLTPEERSEILSREILRYTSRGWRVQSQSQTQAQLVKGKNHSHLLHLILTLLTLGIWLLVWIPLALFGGEKHNLIAVNEHGQT
jgi:hypothetical protein